MKKTLAAALLAAAVAASAPAAGIVLGESRGEATVARTLERLGIPDTSIWHPEETVLRDFVLSRDIPSLVRNHVGAHSTFIYSLPPADRDAWLALFADGSWSNAPGAPEGIQAFVPPSRSFTNYVAEAGGKLLLSESLDDLQATLAVLPDLPDTLPAEGDLVLQFTGNDLATIFDSPLPSSSPEIRKGLATITAGLGIDGDTAACHIVVAPVPGTELAGQFTACGPIPPSTACVNLPGAIAFAVRGTVPLSDEISPSPLLKILKGFIGPHPFAAALFPPAAPAAPPRALAFLERPEAPDAPDAAREAFLDLLSPHSDALSFDASDYRGIPIATLAVSNPDALPPLLTRYFLCPEHLAPFLASVIGSRNPTVQFAWIPGALLLSCFDGDASLLHSAIDAALDGTALPFDQSPAFRAAFPAPDAPAHAIVHFDGHVIDTLLPAIATAQPLELPTPCPVDLFAGVASDGTPHIVRLRAPVPLVQAIVALHNAASEDELSEDELSENEPSEKAPSGDALAENAPAGDAPSGGEASSRAGGPGAQPPSVATPAPAPDGGPSARPSTPLPPTPFRGYPEAYVLHNDRIHAVIVPAISRLAFLAPSADAPNLLRFDPALADAGALPPDPSTAPDFFNIGGDWVWPVLQSRWPAFTVDGAPYGRDWPPPPALADGPSTAEAWTDEFGSHVRLTRHYPAPVHATLVREFILAPDGNVLECKQSLTRDPSPCVDETPLPIALWHISQVANPNAIHIPVDSPDFVPTVMSGTLLPDSFRVKTRYFMLGHESTATYTPPPSSEVKLSLPFANLMATTLNGHFLVRTSDPDAHAELYSNTGLGYAELETVTPDYSSIPNMWAIANTLTYHVAPPAHTELYSNTGLGYAELETVTPKSPPPSPTSSSTPSAPPPPDARRFP